MEGKIEIRVRTLSGGRACGLLCRFSDNLSSLEEPCILLLENLRIDDVMRVFDYSCVRGVIAKHGGFTSHGASILREIRMPCVLMIHSEDLSSLVGSNIVLDADNGEIITANNESLRNADRNTDC